MKRGRPPVAPQDRAVEVCLSLSAKDYDAFYRQARAARVSVPELLRRQLNKTIGSIPGTPRRP